MLKLEWNCVYLETFDNVEIYENDDEAFDAMAVDQERNQIIIGAK